MCAYKFDVFLSFSGPDARNGFADCLYKSLTTAKVKVLRDEELSVGTEIRQGLIDAIRSSRIAIPIISRQYAQSKWCLLELSEIMRCRTERHISVFPVFYKVDVVDITRSLVPESQGSPKETLSWTVALMSVKQIGGWVSPNIANGFEVALVNMVVAKVLSELKGMRMDRVDRLLYSFAEKKRRESCQVFLAFRGPDSRHGFTGYLYTGLIEAGIRAFMFDGPSLIGTKIRDEIRDAIDHSKISIPILSENYASSSWCLDELAQMVQCRRTKQQKILPVFYKVKPSDVQNARSRFDNDMKSHMHRGYELTHYSEWKQAFEEVGSIIGWESEKFHNGHEGKLVEQIAKHVWKLLYNPETHDPSIPIPEY